jgi:putative transposase
MSAPNRKAVEKEIEAFGEEYGAKYPKAVESLTRDRDELLTFFDFPAEHWLHIRTSNAMESAFATVRLRQRVTKGAGSRKRGLMMAFKLLEMAQLRWRRLNGAALLPLVRASVPFKDGVRIERDDQTVVEQGAEVAA